MSSSRLRTLARAVAILVCLVWSTPRAPRLIAQQDDESSAAKRVYTSIKRFALNGGSAEVSNLVLKRDRVEMTFTGTLYFTSATDDRAGGAVFIGQATMRAAVPDSVFERENVRRLLGADSVESDFKTAVLRWTDDTLKQLDVRRNESATATEQATRLAASFEPAFLRETGGSLSARLAASILNREEPGVFFAQFDGGRRGRFNHLFDPQTRMPVANFNVNAGEKGVIFARQESIKVSEIWMAFYSLDDYARRTVACSDANDLVDITRYQMDLDVRQFDKKLALAAHMEMTPRLANVRATPFNIGESLPTIQDLRLEKQLRVKSAKLGGQPISWTQEDWEGGFTVFLPATPAANQPITVDVELEGDFIQGGDIVKECYYPLSNTEWYPRHGYLDRATFDLTFRHRKHEKIASIGVRVSEQPDPADKDVMITKYQMTQPIALAVSGRSSAHHRSSRWRRPARRSRSSSTPCRRAWPPSRTISSSPSSATPCGTSPRCSAPIRIRCSARLFIPTHLVRAFPRC